MVDIPRQGGGARRRDLASHQVRDDLQLLGGVWILQTLPSIVVRLNTRWLHRWALLVGWAAGMLTGTLMATSRDFKSSVYPLNVFGIHIAAYETIFAVVLNLVISIGLTAIFAAVGAARCGDETRASDYEEPGEHRAATAPAFRSPVPVSDARPPGSGCDERSHP